MKALYLFVLLCMPSVLWHAFHRRRPIDTWASEKVATLISGAMPARWPEVNP